jgi:hypothetical protein
VSVAVLALAACGAVRAQDATNAAAPHQSEAHGAGQAPAEAPAPTNVVVRVNCGGTKHVDRLGNVYELDQAYADDRGWGYVGGQPSAARSGTTTEGADEPQVFLTDRWGVDAYRFRMKPGVYRVTIYASEYHFKEPGGRVFDIVVNGRVVVKGLDLVDRVGQNHAFSASTVVLTEDGSIEVKANDVVDKGKFSAITVEPAEPDQIAPPVPAAPATYSRGKEVGLDWADVDVEDLKGYNIYRSDQRDGEYKRLNDKPLRLAWYVDAGLENDKAQFYRLSAVDFFDNESAKGDAAEATPRAPVPGALAFGLNVGGAELLDAQGRRFVADRAWNPANAAGYTAAGRVRKGGASSVEPFTSVRDGEVAYQLDLPPGLYKVVLGFYDEWSREAKDRVFHAWLDSFRALRNFDLVAQYGSALPVEVSRVYRVGKGGLRLSLEKKHGSPILAFVYVEPAERDEQAPAVPSLVNLVARDAIAYVEWAPVNEPDVIGYTVLRAEGDSTAYRMVATGLVGVSSFVDKSVKNDVAYRYQVAAMDASGNESPTSASAELTPKMPNDDELLEIISRAAFAYFANECDPKTFLTKDKNLAEEISVAAAGFGLSAYAVAAERGWMAKAEAENRAYLMLRALNTQENNKEYGILFHYLRGSGARSEHGYEDAASTIDTALLAWGALGASGYFGGRVQEEVDILIGRMNWKAFANESRKLLAMAYRPAAQAFDGMWDYYSDETLLVALLAIGAPKEEFRVAPNYFYSFKRDRRTYKGIPDIVCSWSGAMFTYAFAHCWLDFRSLGPDNPEALGLPATLKVDWWENSVKAMTANREYCIAMSKKFKTFGENAWGLTASSGPDNRYVVAAAPPCGDSANPAEGTLALYGAGMAVPFLTEQAMAALRNYYTMRDADGKKMLWRDEFDGGYGFIDSYNLDKKFFSKEVQGIDQGPMLLLIENHRSGLLWKSTIKNKVVREALTAAGFKVEQEAAAAPAATAAGE